MQTNPIISPPPQYMDGNWSACKVALKGYHAFYSACPIIIQEFLLQCQTRHPKVNSRMYPTSDTARGHQPKSDYQGPTRTRATTPRYQCSTQQFLLNCSILGYCFSLRRRSTRRKPNRRYQLTHSPQRSTYLTNLRTLSLLVLLMHVPNAESTLTTPQQEEWIGDPIPTQSTHTLRLMTFNTAGNFLAADSIFPSIQEVAHPTPSMLMMKYLQEYAVDVLAIAGSWQ